MFFDEEMLLDLRLNIMSKYVEKFIITEASYMHSGKPKKLNFDINKFSKFKDKIIYKVIDKEPSNIEPLKDEDDDETRSNKLIDNSSKREHFQREMALKTLENIEPDDYILINDVDEIPNLENINFEKIKEKLIFFKQKMFYYKFNLLHETLPWYGTRACKKKNFISPQWLRDVKQKKYPFWRLDTVFSKTKYKEIHYVKNGGWHFTNIKTPENIEKKYSNFLHHHDFEIGGLKLNDIKQIVRDKKIIYDHTIDQRGDKWNSSATLKKLTLSEMPYYLRQNYKKYINWLEI